MWKASFKFYGVIVMAIFVEMCMACKVGIFDVCNTIRPHLPDTPRRSKEFLYFQNAGDIERMTVSKGNMLMEISLTNGSEIHKNHDGFVEIQGSNNESMTVSMSTLEVTVYATNGIGKMIITLNITEVGTTYANKTLHTHSEDDTFLSLVSTHVDDEKHKVTINSSCAVIVFRKVFDAQRAIRAEVGREQHPDVEVRIAGYENTTIYERRNSDDVYLIKNESDVWEEMYIRPPILLVLAVNHLGSLFFQRDFPIITNSWNGTRVIGSPEGKRYGEIVEQNVTRQVRFSPDGCSEVTEHSGSRKLIVRARPPMVHMVDHDKTLKIEPHKRIYAISPRGFAYVDLEKRIVQMNDDKNEGMTYFPLANETKKWFGGAGTVEHLDESFVEDQDYSREDPTDTRVHYKPKNWLTWEMRLEMGILRFPTSSSVPSVRIFSARDKTVHIIYHTGDGFETNDATGVMHVSCHYTSQLVGSGGERIENNIDSNVHEKTGPLIPATFFLKNKPGTVRMRDNEAIVRGYAGIVTITPLELDIDY